MITEAIMEFNEMIHAYIAAKYCVYLEERFGERGKEAFLHRTRHYAQQRGRRMAQRAIRDGQPLTYRTYVRYGEWVNTQSAKEAGVANDAKVVSIAPDYEVHIFTCPWHAQFKKMGLVEEGLLYCRDLDASICRGFNPDIDYRTLQTLHDRSHCIQTVADSGLTPDMDLSKNPSGLKDFEYHCAHSYFAYKEVCEAIFSSQGEMIASDVLRDLARDYGTEMADRLFSYRNTDFNSI